MLFKFASYLLGTNYEDENKPDLQIENQKQETENTFDDLKKNEDVNEENNLNNEINENSQENNYIYSECIIKSPYLNKNNLESVNNENDCEEENWIYISPIKRKSVEDQGSSSDNSDLWDEESEDEEIIKTNSNSEELNSKEENLEKKEKARFNFYDYFNNKTSYNEEDESSVCSKKPSMKSFSNNEKDQNKGYSNRMEESWVIHPPACFQLDNTFTIEEHPLENLYIENPALSVIASCKSLEKENSLILINSNKKFNSKIILTSHDNKVVKKDVKPSSRKPMQKSNSTRKTGKKQNKKNKKQMKKNELETTSKSLINSKENSSENNEQQKQQVLRERQEKQLLAHYLTINPKAFNIANSFVPSPNVSANNSANNSTNHSHQHNHFISSSSNSTNTTINTVEHQNGSKGLKRNNKVALKRENLSKNKPFTLHRKLC